ncbi:MAG TPA: hypothetical protein VMG30_09810 [Acidobacteriota bacterium]|nr:hypothetical protein [Acidobacteriota bacterium]
MGCKVEGHEKPCITLPVRKERRFESPKDIITAETSTDSLANESLLAKLESKAVFALRSLIAKLASKGSVLIMHGVKDANS